jgi:hypothetical protein
MKPQSILLFVAVIIIAFTVAVIAGSPGDSVGVTQLDYQVGVTPGNRIAIDKEGGASFTWLSSLVEVMYNYVDSSGNLSFPGGLFVANGVSPQVAVDSLNRPGIAFTNIGSIFYWTQWGSTHNANQNNGGFAPSLTLDDDDNVHIFAASNLESGNPPQYFRSSDGGETWADPTGIFVDFVYPTTPRIITSSPVSNKVAVVFPYPRERVLPTNRYDILYKESTDGVNWDWEGSRVNVTNYQGPLYASHDLDAVYDYNDNLHLIWTARNSTDTTVSDTTILYHYSFDTGVNEITRLNIAWPNSECNLGTGNRPICRVSMGASISGSLLAVAYNRFDPGDCSAGGYPNGEVYCQYSNSGGQDWSSPINLTTSPSPGCAAGNCDSDIGPTLAERIDNYLHLFYIDDKDAGAITYSEGVLTNNPLLYLKIPVNSLGINEPNPVPKIIALMQNYPNPFNGSTIISFELAKRSLINLAIYDIKGSLVEILVNGIKSAGRQTVTWRPIGVSSGIYFCRLTTLDGSIVKRLAYIK